MRSKGNSMRRMNYLLAELLQLLNPTEFRKMRKREKIKEINGEKFEYNSVRFIQTESRRRNGEVDNDLSLCLDEWNGSRGRKS